MDTSTLNTIMEMVKAAGTTGLALLFAIGATNIIGIFKPGMDSRIKIGIAFLSALAVSFVPAEFASLLVQHVIVAIEATVAGSGVYKLFQINGSKSGTSIEAEERMGPDGGKE